MGRTPSAPVLSTRTLVVAMCVGIYLLVHGLRGETAPQPSANQAHTPPAAQTAHPASTAARPDAPGKPAPHPPSLRTSDRNGDRSRSEPVRLRIPAIGVDAPVMKLALDAAGTLQVPPVEKAGFAGWYAKGPAPGEAGTAVVAGHVDTPSGRAVFYSLGALGKGSLVEVARQDRRTAVFKVDAVEVYPKKTFPSRKVYGSTAAPQLRIITCGGGYSKKSGYLGNVVVYASLAAIR
ncbi:class F sortase [Streptomyces sp. HNM0663]|uniref:Class F sortase n=1 Tax=Streptomyces chengmaiensis TaxID=3040919 RepID=A0ABT6HLV6_9ACTN|nr:class F sortase [Streptomyces chengmaiensis]MDH2389711.1 class F sortase [Streptomyces chengmaiensis]